jgi:hypothetical protein
MFFPDDDVRGATISWYADRQVSDRNPRHSSTQAVSGSPTAGSIADVH